MQCLCCLSKWSESRQPWLQASVTAGLECVPIAHSKQRDPNLSTILIHSKLLPHLTPQCMSSAALCTLSFCKICLWLLCLSSLMLTHQQSMCMYVYTNIQKRFIWIRKRSDTAKFIILVKSDFLAFAALIAFFFFVEMHGHYCFYSFFFFFFSYSTIKSPKSTLFQDQLSYFAYLRRTAKFHNNWYSFL